MGRTQENDGVAAVRTNRIQRSSASLTGDLSRGGERRTQGAPRNGPSQPSPSSSSGDDCCAALACLLPRAKPLVIKSGTFNGFSPPIQLLFSSFYSGIESHWG